MAPLSTPRPLPCLQLDQGKLQLLALIAATQSRKLYIALGPTDFAAFGHPDPLSSDASKRLYVVAALTGAREVELHSKVSPHDSIASVRHTFEENGTIYLVMDHVSNINLQQAMNNKSDMFEENPELGRDLFRQLLEAIVHCHAHNVFHCDIKLEHIVYDDDRRKVKLVNFAHAARNKTGLDFGTGHESYMSPERSNEWTCEVPYDNGADDVWALGVVLYQMLIGRGQPPWSTATPFDQRFQAFLQNPAGSPRPYFTSYPFAHILHQIFEPEPKKRITASGLQDALDRLVVTRGESSSSSSQSSESRDDYDDLMLTSTTSSISSLSFTPRTPSLSPCNSTSSSSADDENEIPSSPVPYKTLDIDQPPSLGLQLNLGLNDKATLVSNMAVCPNSTQDTAIVFDSPLVAEQSEIKSPALLDFMGGKFGTMGGAFDTSFRATTSAALESVFGVRPQSASRGRAPIKRRGAPLFS